MPQRHLPSDAPRPPSVGNTDTYLTAAIEDIVTNYPPRSRYSHDQLHGLWSGPTAVAHLLLHVASRRPDLVVAGRSASDWALRYLAEGSRGHNLRLGSRGCGLGDEALTYAALRAAVTAKPQDIGRLVDYVEQLGLFACPDDSRGGGHGHGSSNNGSSSRGSNGDDYPDEMLYGRAGALYLLRLVRTRVRQAGGNADAVDPAIAELSNAILSRGPHWRWHGARYLGAVHGDAGIVTQLVLASPELAPRAQPILERLLDVQRIDGNWPSAEEPAGGIGRGGSKELVQFCHGAPGVVLSLLALRPHFPELHDRIDAAVARARDRIAERGLLTKEPSLCHGIFGNALALDPPRREQFLAVATPENVARLKMERGVFERADYGRSYSALASYTPSAVWTWLVWKDEEPAMFAYSDV
ncbi:hypothetical protein VTJ83DRAFT_2779 [Remersonia thermophila]|uniref:Uncharacterized protein n=1 Tax=Remersonia thermophila TaxID=72144 RepID=A0ABR4DJS4_9PEZI